MTKEQLNKLEINVKHISDLEFNLFKIAEVAEYITENDSIKEVNILQKDLNYFKSLINSKVIQDFLTEI